MMLLGVLFVLHGLDDLWGGLRRRSLCKRADGEEGEGGGKDERLGHDGFPKERLAQGARATDAGLPKSAALAPQRATRPLGLHEGLISSTKAQIGQITPGAGKPDLVGQPGAPTVERSRRHAALGGLTMWDIVGLARASLSHASRQFLVAAAVGILSGAMGLAGLPGAGQAHAVRVLQGPHFEDTAVLGERTLRLNGLGLRGVAWIKAFVTGLYLAAPTTDAGQALAMQGPKRLRMKVILEAPSRAYAKAFAKGIRRNEPEKVQAALASRLTDFVALIDSLGTIRQGDIIDMDYLPGAGTQLRLNGQAVGSVVEGEDFYRALLKIYIGEKPADLKMKEGLLRGGGTPA